MHDCLALNSAGALIEMAAAAGDTIGAAITKAGNITTGQSDAVELRPYFQANATGKFEPVAVFNRSNVFETDDYNTSGQRTYADIGARADLELMASGEWGINIGTTSSAGVPNFAIIDVIRETGTVLVIPDIILEAAVFQFFDGAV
jgi:hypothetical protein